MGRKCFLFFLAAHSCISCEFCVGVVSVATANFLSSVTRSWKKQGAKQTGALVREKNAEDQERKDAANSNLGTNEAAQPLQEVSSRTRTPKKMEGDTTEESETPYPFPVEFDLNTERQLKDFAKLARETIIFHLMQQMKTTDQDVERAVKKFVTQEMKTGKLARLRPIHAAIKRVERNQRAILLTYQDLGTELLTV